MAERIDARNVFTLKSAHLLLENPISELDFVIDLGIDSIHPRPYCLFSPPFHSLTSVLALVKRETK